jgi:hypothetical protein
MHKFIMFSLTGIFCLAVWLPAQAGGTADSPVTVIPCDQPGATPGGTTPLDQTTAPCDTGVIRDLGNTSVTSPEAPGQERLPAQSETKQVPPPHNPNPHPQTYDK